MCRALTIFLAISSLLFAQSREKRVVPVDPAQRQSFERQPKVAVLAGVSHYPSRSGMGALAYPTHDVDLLGAELAKQGYNVVKLQDGDATRGSVEQTLKDAAELVDRGKGTVLFFFSGHGFADKGVNYLAPFEASSSDLAGTGIPIRRVEELLKATGAPRQVMFVDACRNDPGKKSAGARSFGAFEAAEGLAELYSTKIDKISYESDQLGSGVFTHFLVRGLQGEAARADGLVTFRDLADYVTDGVSNFGFQTGQMQVPFEAGEHRGDFLLARISGNPTPVTPPSYPPLPNGGLAASRMGSAPRTKPLTEVPKLDAAAALSQGESAFNTRNYATALLMFRQSADAGNADAMRWMGWMFHNGLGVGRDYNQAIGWYTKAANLGDAMAMRNMAAVYEAQENYAQAMAWNRKSADAGYVGALNAIGNFYKQGVGVPQDYKEAMNWFRKGAVAGNAAAMNNLGWGYHNGKGLPQDFAEAMKWYRLSADGGDSGGMNNVGFLYLYGLGVTKNEQEAISWFRKAAAAGSTEAANTLRKMGVQE
jgi:TPR repeat protein